ncbi:uncharacterized protein MYU51_011257 [Penicillium brevicompactum]
MAESLLVSNLFNIKGIVAVVTGGGSGLGLSITIALAVNGAKRVYILGRRIDVLELAAKEIGLNNVIPIQCDITNQQQLKSTVASIENDVGYINLLVANSGIAGPSGNVPADASISQVQEALYKIPMEEFTNTMHVNSTGVFYTIVAFLSLLDAGNKDGTYQNGRSQVITTSSIGGFIMAADISPVFPTDLTASLIDGKEPTEEGAFPLDKIPAERAGLPEDIVGPVLYLASRAGAYCNGNCVITDGGKLSVTPATY